MIYAGAAPGTDPVVRIFNIENGFPASTDITVAASSFTGGVRVASADFTADGVPDIVAALGPGGTPTIRVFDALTGEAIDGPLASFDAFESTFTGGVFIATADVDGDGIPDIIAGAGAGGGPRVKVFSGADGVVLESFFAFETTFTGGVNVAAADLTGDGKADLIVGAGTGGGPRVRVIDPTTDADISGPLGSFFAFDSLTHDGVSVSAHAYAGDVNADGTPDVVVGTQNGPASRVKVYSGADGSVLSNFAPFGSGVGSAVSVGVAYIDDDDTADVVGAAQDLGGTVRVFGGATGSMISGGAAEFLPFDPASGGVTIAAGVDPNPAWNVSVILPEVSLKTTDKTASEAGESTGVFVFHRAGSAEDSLTAEFEVRAKTGDAVRGTDYVLKYADGTVLTTNEVVFPAGKVDVAVLVKPINDALPDQETVHLTVLEDSSLAPIYTVDPEVNAALVTILDDDPPSNGQGTEGGEGQIGGGGGKISGTPNIVIAAADPYSSEDGESTGAFTISALGEVGATLSKAVTVDYLVSVGGQNDATPEDDYVPIANPNSTPFAYTGQVTISAGSSKVTFHVEPVDDDLPEDPEHVTVTLLDGGPDYIIAESMSSETVELADNEPRIVIAYAHGGEVTQKDGLKVAKWKDAFELAADGKSVKIKEPVNGIDFIDRDPDRFNVWAYDKKAYDNNITHIEASLSTTNVAGFEMYNDAANAVDLTRYTGKAKGEGWYWSDSQFLVSDEADDIGLVKNYLATDEATPDKNTTYDSDGYTWYKSDRTHRIALRGTLKAEYSTPAKTYSATAPVHVKKNVKVHPILVRDKSEAAGGSTISVEDADKYLHRANEQYAQVGILLTPTGYIAIDPPPGVNLADGLDGFPEQYDAANKIKITAEEVALLVPSYKNAANQNIQVRTAAVDDVELYFVNYFSDNRVGEAFRASKVPDARYEDSAVISIRDYVPAVIPHEIGHVLELNHDFSGMKLVNLMFEKAEQVINIDDPKRLTDNQSGIMLNTRKNLLTGP